MEKKYIWNLSDIFKTKGDLENEIKKLNDNLEKIQEYKGKLKLSSENIYKCYNFFSMTIIFN